MRPVVHIFGPEAGLEYAVDKAKDGDMYHAENGKDFVFIGGEWLPLIEVSMDALKSYSAPEPVKIEPVAVEAEPQPVVEEPEEEPKPKKKRTKKEK